MVAALLAKPLTQLVRRTWARVLTPAAPARPRHCEGEPLCPACAASLFEGLNHVLDLASRLPPDVHGDTVRRSVCELIEAGSAGERHHKLRRLLAVIAGGPAEISQALQALKRQGTL